MPTRKFEVPKSELDPFGQRFQAEARVRRQAVRDLPPNVESVEIRSRDAGDHIGVEVSAYPNALARQQARARGRGPPDWLSLPADIDLGLEPEGAVDGRPIRRNPARVIEHNLHINEIRSELSRLGHYYPQTASKRELAELLLRLEPVRAARIAGV